MRHRWDHKFTTTSSSFDRDGRCWHGKDSRTTPKYDFFSSSNSHRVSCFCFLCLFSFLPPFFLVCSKCSILVVQVFSCFSCFFFLLKKIPGPGDKTRNEEDRGKTSNWFGCGFSSHLQEDYSSSIHHTSSGAADKTTPVRSRLVL